MIMDYKEKYEKLKGLVSDLYPNMSDYCKEKVDGYFHESTESEDEQIRKSLIKHLDILRGWTPGDPSPIKRKEYYDVWLSWLEKQGKKNPVISDDALREGITHFGITQHQIDNWLKKYVDVENQGEKDVRRNCLEDLLASDVIYQMAMNDAMVEEARTKAVNALSKLAIGELLGIKKQDEWKPAWGEDEKIRKELIKFFSRGAEFDSSTNGIKDRNIIAWLEKQSDTDVEQVFRPLAGCCIDVAAKLAVEQQNQGKNIVLAFNGCYIPVKNDTVDAIVNKYNTWLEKQGGIGKTNEKLRQYREYLIKETERWHKMKEDEKLSKVGRQDCTGHANAYIAARREFEALFNYDSWLEKQGELQYWKPSEEQLEALDYAYNLCPDTERGNYYERVLRTLIDDLHKLSEKQRGQKETLCDKCRREQPSHSCQDITELGRCAVEHVRKPAEKVEPKFKVGDWITNSIETVQITGYDIDYGYQVDYRGNLQHRDTDIIEKFYHLWTIQDANDGDVLVTPPIKGSEHSEQIFIFKEIKDRDYVKNAVEYYCRCMDNEFALNERGFMGQSDDYFTPATKEQRDLLFQKMKEAGYEWDSEKKELKKIEQKPIESDWVDLGLPSGTLWKSSNETNPSSVDNDFYTYGEAVRKFGDQLPTKEQWEELKNNCQWTWTGNGYKVTGSTDNSIFLPAAGYSGCGGEVYDVGSYGEYWASKPCNPVSAWCFEFNPQGVSTEINIRNLRQSVRLVNKY